MDCISAFGIDSATRIGDWGRSIIRPLTALVALATLTGTSNLGELDVTIGDLRNEQGMLHLCLSQDPKTFLECADDPNAAKLSRPASESLHLHFGALPAGRYALSVIHDENANGKLDTFLAIPREGFGFSQNPKIGIGPPSFEEVRFMIDGGSRHLSVEMNYLL